MSEVHVYPVKENIKTNTHADNDTYLSMYQQSVSDLKDSGESTAKSLIGLSHSPKSNTPLLTLAMSTFAGLKMAH
ncbi:acetyl-coenzyme A synthetase [Vibrio variabilis]|nr:acetyl-coenzyme A synthetase [Vibrio variabilis]